MGLEDLTGNDKFIDDFNLSWPDGSADQVLTLELIQRKSNNFN